jgi:hypothetical protein
VDVLRPSTARTTRPGTRSSAASTGSSGTGLATRFDKLAVRFKATVLIAAINEWL